MGLFLFWAVGPAVLVQKLEYRDSGEVLLASNDLLLSAPLGPEGQGGQIQAGASCGRNNRLVSGAVLQFSQAGFILRRENWLSTRGVSTPLLYLSRLAGFCRGHKCPCENRSAAPAAAPCIVHWTRSPPLPSGLPTHPQRPGDDPLDPKGEGRSGRLAEKALYCALEENAHRFFRAVLIRRVLRTKQPNENWRSALIFASIILDAPQKSAKRKRMQPPDAPISYARPSGAPVRGAGQAASAFSMAARTVSESSQQTSTTSPEGTVVTVAALAISYWSAR